MPGHSLTWQPLPNSFQRSGHTDLQKISSRVLASSLLHSEKVTAALYWSVLMLCLTSTRSINLVPNGAFVKGNGKESWHVTQLSSLPGLRTLCFAVADVSESSYQQWLELHHRASTSLQNRALKLEESYELIEKVTEKCACGVSVSDAMTSYCVPWTSLRKSLVRYFIKEYFELAKGEAVFLCLVAWSI